MADEQIRKAVEANVSESMYSLMQPANLTVNRIIYAHEDNTKFEATQLEIRQGVVKIPASSTNLASTLTFTILNSKIQDIFYLHGQITLPQYAMIKSKFFLDAVNDIQIQIPGSGNIQMSGTSWKDFLLRSSSTAQKEALNDMMPYYVDMVGGYKYEFVTPVVLPWCSAVQSDCAFPLDGDSLQNNVIVSITLKPVYQWIGCSQSGGAHVRTLPTAWDFLYLKPFNLISHTKEQLSIGRMRQEYRIPTYYLQTYQVNGVALTGTQQSIVLQSFPNAQLVSILINVSDDSKYMSSSNLAAGQTLVNPANISLTQMRLNWNGLDIIELGGPELVVQKCYAAGRYDGSLTYNTYNATSISNNAQATYTESLNVLECFILDPNKAFQDAEYAMSRNYSGQTLTLFFTAPAAVASATLTFTYVCNAVLDVTNGVGQYFF
jgi:hypothetical protein